MIIFLILISVDFVDLAMTDSLNSNRCFPVELASHLCCHFSNLDSLIAAFTSSMVTASVTSGVIFVVKRNNVTYKF